MKAKFNHLIRLVLLLVVLTGAVMSLNISAYQPSGGSLALVYLPLALLGQAFILSLLLGLLLWPFSLLPAGWFNRLFALTGGILVFLLAVDCWVFSVYRFHINAFFIKMFFTDLAGMGIGQGLLFGGLAALMVTVGLMLGLATLISRYRWLTRPMRTFWVLLLATFVGQGIHAWGYAHNMKAIISLTHTIPWYTPVTATTDIKQWGLFNEALLEENLNLDVANVTGFRYPAQPLNCIAPTGATPSARPNIVVAVLESWRFDRMSAEVTPNIAAIGDESLVFSNHLSTGTVTDKGMFGLVYGVSPVYFNTAVGAGRETTIIQATKALGYDHWILANQDIEVNKLDTLLFNGIEPIQSLPKGAVYEGDRQVVRQFEQLLTQKSAEQPFFSLMLFNSSHFPYWTPPDMDLPFLPDERFAISKANDATDPTAYFNQYSNSLYYLDSLVGEVRQSLIDQGEWDNTILVITGDHGEEFADQDQVFWGHGSNFSRYQTSVPLVIHWPGKSASLEYRTSHEDIMPTLITEALGCDVALNSLSTGYSLFDDSDRVLMVESYVNQAVIVDDSVSEILPGFVLSYSLDDIDQPTKASAASLVGIQAIYDRFR